MAKKNLLNVLPPDGALKKYLPQLFESYSGLTPAFPSSFFIWSDKDEKESKIYTHQYCHGDLPYVAPGIYDHLVTAVPDADPLSLAYQRMLINGPFKSLSDLISLEQAGDNYYIRCSDLCKWPANVLYNYCIATRVPIEFEQMLPRWAELTEKGFHPTLAFLLSYSTNGKAWEGTRDFVRSNHLWMDASSDWANIIQGEMRGVTPPFKDYPKGSRPCNVIWGNAAGNQKFSLLSDEDLSALFQLPIEPPAPPPKVRKMNKFDNALAFQQHINALQAAGAEAPNNQQIAPPPPWANIDWAAPADVVLVNNVNAAPPLANIHDEVQIDLADDDDDEDLDFDEWGPEPDFDEDD